jgi:DeoR/GlpR family transcriptional regulator of sugar metabolism
MLRTGEGDVDGLARHFAVSASTVRRDLQRLSDENAVLRTYGGAILPAQNPEQTLDKRIGERNAEKRAIARAAATLVQDGETVILDVGTTVLAFAQFLRGKRLRVVTNNLAVVPVLAADAGIELVMLGGALRATSMGTIGPLAIEAMRRMTADKVFMSADGVVAGRGLSEASLDQVTLKSVMMEQSRDVIVLADATKLGRAGPSAWAALPSRWTLVTDATASDAQIQALAATGAQVTTAALE